MQVKIKSVNGGSDLPCNLQRGITYQALRIDSERMKVTCDDGQVITTNIKKSGYLGNFGEWEVLKEEG